MQKKTAWPILVIFGILLLTAGCSKQPLAPEETTRVHFKVTFLPSRQVSSNEGRLAKANLSATIDEAKVVVLDLSQYTSFEEFHEALYNSGQQIDQIFYLDNSIPWVDWIATLKSSAENLYGFYGTFTLDMTDTGAVGTINVKPGLNFFGLAFLDQGEIKFMGTTMDSIADGKDNLVELQIYRLFKKDYPRITIYSPSNGDTLFARQQAWFRCGAWDAQDGQLSDEQIQWSSSLDGVLGTGIELSDTLSVGTHVIRATATDRDGHVSSAAVRVTVLQ
jgi:hypothetical protein